MKTFLGVGGLVLLIFGILVMPLVALFGAIMIIVSLFMSSPNRTADPTPSRIIFIVVVIGLVFFSSWNGPAVQKTTSVNDVSNATKALSEKQEKLDSETYKKIVKAFNENKYQEVIELYVQTLSSKGKNTYKDANVLYNQSREKALLSEIQKLPASDIQGNLDGYRRLLSMDPSNELYKSKLNFYQEKVQAKNKEIKNLALSKMLINKDKVDGITWYKHKTTSKYINRNDFYIYIGQSDSNPDHPWLRLKLQMVDDRWVFFEEITVSVDGKRFTLDPDDGDYGRDNDSSIWEWCDFQADPYMNIIDAVANGKNVIIRFRGANRYHDNMVSSTQRLAIKETLAAFRALRGTF